MRGITTPVTKIRRQVFTEIARLAYEDGDYPASRSCPTPSSRAKKRIIVTVSSRKERL